MYLLDIEYVNGTSIQIVEDSDLLLLTDITSRMLDNKRNQGVASWKISPVY